MRHLLLLLSLATTCVAAAGRPNIVLIMADDMGYENLSCHGSKLYSTPNIDALAASGARFEHAHSQPICTPTRVQIMTGIYNNRNYIKFGLLDPKATTFGNLLKDAGYNTCVAGKWQLGGGFEGPRKFGFDRYCLWQLTRKPSRYANPGFEIDGKEVDFKNGEFGPDVVTDYICNYMKERKEAAEPFFVYYPMMLPHWPFVPTPGSPDWDPAMWREAKNEPGGFRDQKYWAGFVSYTDKMVGKVVAKLDELGIRENTLVIFTGDNGTYTGIRHEFMGREMQGGKGSTRDNGTHVPFIASWPGKIQPGQVRDELVDFTDVLPTLCAAGSATIPATLPTDGRSLVPLLEGGGQASRDFIYCWYERDGIREKASQHVRDARYKLYSTGRFFDTLEDPLEQRNLAASRVPEELTGIHASLKQALDARMTQTTGFDAVQKAKRGSGKEGKRKKKAKQLD